MSEELLQIEFVHKTLTEALVAFQAEAPKLLKGNTAKAGSFSYKYVDLASVMDAIQPLLAKHGLSWSAFPTFGPDGSPALRYQLRHSCGESVHDCMPLLIQKNDPQGLGSGITYARRYALLSVLNLVADEDDDGAKASKQPSPAVPTQQAAPSVKLATPSDVKEIKAAAEGLPPELVKLAVASCGLDGLTKYSEVPADKVVPLIRALGGAQS